MTLAEKILSRKAGRSVEPGEFLLLEPDVALANDITAPLAIKKFREYGGKRVKYPERTVLVPDHFTPNKDIKSAMQVKVVREFAREQGIEMFFEIGRMGIEHVLLPEEGIVKSGDFVVGADSHTCTYGALGAFATGVGSTDIAGFYLIGKVWIRVPESIKVWLKGKFKEMVTAKDLVLKLISILGVDGANYKAIEFSGPGVKEISMDGRFTISNMAIEAGGKTGLFPVDEITISYEKERGIEVEEMYPDEDAKYVKELELDLSELEPQVAYPFLPSNAKDVSVAEREKIKIDQVVIGSCTNGRIEDLRLAAQILEGRTVAPNVRCIVIPGSQRVYKQALREGFIDVFIDAGCVVSTPTCGPCLGGHMGVLAEGEIAVSTTNRNFVGRMGHPNSKVFLASPAVAAASAVKGYIADPRKL
ncbi:3-isopropylmalate dehydratase large subunit [Thermotoga sp. KOL6]|uniref:3-isopropylmalate dehydratase large subunit n=1 Tax=Thermotoga sp. KOL6 TaxID=126741 RepID=UPI000C772359|nr:3-isopropylmalate dehydratase large subunit [Thermotoga sp. KOL6]PLV59272.1 3-isopropylmalate dehydratase large subunit [Thermotoga sp. KOL6]